MSKEKKHPLSGVAVGLLAVVSRLSYPEQLQFWQAFRTKHRARIAAGKAELPTALMRAVDEHIALLKRLAATGV